MNTRLYQDILNAALNGGEEEIRVCILLLSEKELARLVNALEQIRALTGAREALFRRLGS